MNWYCAFCKEPAVSLIDGTLVCKVHKSPEQVSEMLRERFAPVFDQLIDRLGQLDEEQKVLRSIKK